MHNHSYENTCKFNLHMNEISFSFEKMGTKTRFEEEAKGNSEMACLEGCASLGLTVNYCSTIITSLHKCRHSSNL